MMLRIPEPEVMDDAAGAAAYASADFSTVNRSFVDRFLRLFPEFRSRRAEILDLGCGPADIPIRLARSNLRLKVSAVDASAAMLRHARRAVKAAGVESQIRLIRARLPAGSLNGRRFDAAVSNSLLHHLPDPAVLWRSIRRLGRRDCRVCVMDLVRPRTAARAKAIVAAYAGREPAVLRKDFYNSLLAAFTLEEVRAQLRSAGLSGIRVKRITDRHWLASGRL